MAKQRLQLTWYNKDKALIPAETGQYGYTWVEPNDPRYCETHTLIYDNYVQGEQTAKSDQFSYSKRADLEPQTDNLLVRGESGDVLEALTRVPELVEKYVGKVALVYIDPPFNTQQAFSSYDDALEHSVWLTMMRDRLLHLKKLLSEDGSIWVHLDHVEDHRMRLLMDEVFGASNFCAEVVWQKADSSRNDVKGFSVDHDVILVYAKDLAQVDLHRMERTAADNARFSNPDGDKRGVWFSADRSAPHNLSGSRQVTALYGIEHPLTGEIFYPARGRQWCFKQDRIWDSLRQYAPYEWVEPDLDLRSIKSGLSREYLREDVYDLLIPENKKEEAKAQAQARIEAGDWPEFFVTKESFGRKAYPPNEGQPARTWWSNNEVGHNRAAKSEIKALFNDIKAFSTPKPERLLERIIHIATNPKDIVLDCFAGSGTTAAVAHKMGRRWVTCELLESTFNTFTRPRLEKVIRNQDPGGITRTEGERVAADGVELPEGVSPDDAAKFTSVLNKLIADDPEAKKNLLVKTLKAAAKTKRIKEVINWRGGGGFQVAHLSPTCFDYDPTLKRVMLTPDATGENLIASVAANLRFARTQVSEAAVFDAKRGTMFLKVIEGPVSTEMIDSLVGHLSPGESLTVAATVVPDGMREYLRKSVKGSRIVAIPDDIFSFHGGGDA